MRNRILQKKLFLTITGIGIIALSANAQVNGPAGRSQPRDTVSATKASDSLTRQVNLPFNTVVKGGNTTAATQAVFTESLIKQPVTNVLNALTGRLAGLYTQQNSGQPGLDAVSLTLRGRTPIILVDGIPRPLTTIDLEEIESVTVLKDAMSTALLGVRGANGAILITTRKGIPNKQVISFTAQTAFQQPVRMPKALNAFDYATLRNEAIDNELKVNPNFNTGLRYSANDLQLFKDQTDPYGHPDVDWRKQILKSSAQLNRYSLNLSGGNNSVQYFATLEHLSQDGLFKTNSANNYNTNNYFSSYLIRSNVDLNLTPKLTGGIHLLGRIYNVNEPGATTASIYNSLLSTPNNAYPVLNPNGSFAGTPQFVNNIQGQATGSGYLQTYTRDILADFFVKRTLDELTPGLYVKALVSYASNLNETINRSKPVVAFQRFVSATGVESYGPALTVQTDQLNTNTISNVNGVPNQGQGRQNYLEASIGYNRTFDKVNSIDAVLLANSDNNVYGSNIGYNVAGISGRGAYNYKQKYLAEVAFSYNGSNYYPGNSHYKYGFFPVFGLGWNISNEDFLKNSNWISSLKLAANYGKTGNDNPGYFAYIQRIFDGPSAYFGTAAAGNQTLVESTLANPNITFEKANKLDVSLQGTLFKKLGFVVDYYNNKFSDVLIQRGRNTTLLGNTYPNENIGRYRYTGFDLQLSWQQPSANGFGYYIAANAGLQQSKVLYIDEPNQLYPYMQRTGQRVGQAFGYQSAGLYQSQADINASAQNGVATVAGYIPQPGDIKYKDLNGDNIINQFDQAPIGPRGPLITYGADLGFNYKFFDFSALIQGVANYSVYLNGNSYWEFQNNGFGQAYDQQLGRFTAATAATATYPRLSIGTNVNNQVFSSYWYRNANYIRLKTVQAGFTLPARYANAVRLKSLRIFVTGINLFTITQLKGRDPEVYNGAYPIQKLVNLGINVKL